MNAVLRISGSGLFKRLPSFLRWPLEAIHGWLYSRHSLNYEKARPLDDPLYNIIITEDEKVSVPYIWTLEMYPPSYARRMAADIERAGWKSTSPFSRGDIQDRIQRARQIGSVNSETIAKLVGTLNRGASMMGCRQERLPKEFRSVTVTMVELRNSLTALVAGFELTEEAALTLDRALRITPEPSVTLLSKGRHSIHSRITMSGKLVEDERARLHAKARKWLGRRTPGIFWALGDGQLPVMVLLITEAATPFISNHRDVSNYLPALGLGPNYLPTTSAELPGIVFSQYLPQHERSLKERNLFTLSGRFSEALADDDPYFNGGPRTMRVVGNRVDEHAHRYLSRIGITSLLDLMERQSAVARDAAYALHRRRSVASVKRVRDSFLRGSLDTLSVATDVRALARDKRRYKWNVVEFFTEFTVGRQSQDTQRAEPENQLDVLATDQLERAEGLLRDDAETRQILGVVASLNASIEGIKSQRWGFAISVLSLAVAIFALIATLGWATFWQGFGGFLNDVVQALAALSGSR